MISLAVVDETGSRRFSIKITAARLSGLWLDYLIAVKSNLMISLSRFFHDNFELSRQRRLAMRSWLTKHFVRNFVLFSLMRMIEEVDINGMMQEIFLRKLIICKCVGLGFLLYFLIVSNWIKFKTIFRRVWDTTNCSFLRNFLDTQQSMITTYDLIHGKAILGSFSFITRNEQSLCNREASTLRSFHVSSLSSTKNSFMNIKWVWSFLNWQLLSPATRRLWLENH